MKRQKSKKSIYMMWLQGLNIFFVGPFLVFAGIIAAEVDDARTAKHFSLFSVVTFKNEECTSETTLAGGARAGTCYSATECSDKSGTKSGNCASGFGVCCVFINKVVAAATVTENRTWIRNAEFPTYATQTTALDVSYTIKKMQTDICQIRLDFELFQIAGPSNSLENIPTSSYNNCNRDKLLVTTTDLSTEQISDPGGLCGSLTGEHLYYDLTPTHTNTMTIKLTTVATGTTGTAITPVLANRIWDFKVSQITCYASYRAPPGCQRYLMTETGQITSLNYRRVQTGVSSGDGAGQNTGLELAGQRLNTCIRRSKGMCCVEYHLCQRYNGIALGDTLNIGADGDGFHMGTWNEAWSIDIDVTPYTEASGDSGYWPDMGYVDAGCTSDYVEIPSSYTGTCGANFGAKHFITTRYCGSKLGFNVGGNTGADLLNSAPICDCSEPFRVTHMSDIANDMGGADNVAINNEADNDMIPRGFCFDFKQTPCWH